MQRIYSSFAIVSCAICLLLSIAALASAAPATLRLASDLWPPFTDHPGHTRWSNELVKTALLRGGFPSESRIMDWSKVLESLRNGDIDGCAAMWRSAEREQYLLFSEPYLENRLVLVGRKGASVNIAGLDGLRGKRVALVTDYAYGTVLEEAKEEMVIVYGASDAENLEAVLSGKAEFMLADEILVHWLFDRYPQKAKQLLVAGTKPLLTKPLHFAIRKDYPGAAEIIADFSRHIDHMRKDGTYNALLGLSWILTDVNGDNVDDYVASAQNKVVDHKDPTKDRLGYRLTSAKEPNSTVDPDSLFVIDGSSYQDWDDASSVFQDRAVKGQDLSPPEIPAGLVLFKFR